MPDVRDQFVSIVDDVTNEANASVAAKEAANRQNILDAGGTIRELDADAAQGMGRCDEAGLVEVRRSTSAPT
jgi:TRAP-type C4-dicarboxylate transport system substrate-binding protein